MENKNLKNENHYLQEKVKNLEIDHKSVMDWSMFIEDFKYKKLEDNSVDNKLKKWWW